MLPQVREDIRNFCLSRNYDPLAELIRIAQSDDPSIPLRLRVEIHKEVLGYLAPKLRNVNVEKYEDRRIEVVLTTHFTPAQIQEAEPTQAVIDVPAVLAQVAEASTQ